MTFTFHYFHANVVRFVKHDPATATNWTLTVVRAINSAGQIVGSGTRNGVTHGILLTPVAP